MGTLYIGSKGEAYAQKFLEEKGYKLLEHNWRSKLGEIDLIFKEGEDVIFVEVKTIIKKSPYFHPEDNLTPSKEKKLKQLALAYLNYRNLGQISYRIDLVAIDLSESLGVIDMRHYESVVEE